MKSHYQIHRISLLVTVLVFVLTTALGATAVANTKWVFSDEDQSDETHPEARELYKNAQKLLKEEHYKKAAQQFEKVYAQYEKSSYAADALYWRAFALYRLGGKSALNDARTALEIQRDKYDKAGTKTDAESLYYRILGKLAEEGDLKAAEKITQHADDEFDVDDVENDEDSDYELEEKMAALQALITMKSERAVPLIKKVLQDRSPKSAKLREQAIFLLTQHRSEESVKLLMEIASEDPDTDVRKAAIFWLSQVRSPEATAFLERMVRESNDEEVLEQALFAVSQQGGEGARKILRDVALDPDKPTSVRENAIFWLGQTGGSEQIEFLTDLYGKVDDEKLKEKIIFSVSQTGGSRSVEWLMKIVRNDKESIDTRKNALFWAGQQKRLELDELLKLYKSLPDDELREQVVFSLSQRSEKKALDIMMELARTEKNRELRKQLIFWIGQSKDPRVEDFLMDIIND